MAIMKAYIGVPFRFEQAKVWIPPDLKDQMRRDLFWVSSKDRNTGDTILTEQPLGKFMSSEKCSLNEYWKRFKDMSSGVLICTSPRIKTLFEHRASGSATSHGPKFVHGDSWGETACNSSMRLGLDGTHKAHLESWAFNHFGNGYDKTSIYRVPGITEMTKILENIGVYYKSLNRVFVPLLFIAHEPLYMLCNIYFPSRVCHYTSVPANNLELQERLDNVCDIKDWKEVTNPEFVGESFNEISQGFSLEPAYLYNADTKGKIRSQYIYLAHEMHTGNIWVFTPKKRNKLSPADQLNMVEEIRRIFLKEGTAAAMRHLFDQYADMSFNLSYIAEWNKDGVRFNIVSTF